jgi:Na+/H+-dicarboxylate symporter
VVDMMRTMTNVTGQVLVPVLVAKEERTLDQTIYDGAVETRAPARETVLVAAE